MQKQQLVSIIIPLYNSEKFLVETLESIKSQTYKYLEIILVDDHSHDNTGLIANKYIEQDKRFKLYINKGKGVSAARNYGKDLANGEFIMFVDSDDTIEKNCVEECINVIKEKKCDIVKFNYWKKYNRRIKNISFIKVLKDLYIEKQDFFRCIYPIFLETYFFNNVWGQLIRTEKIKDISFDEQLLMGEDFKFNLQLYKNCNIFLLDKYLLNYRCNSDGTTRSMNLDIAKKRVEDIVSAYLELVIIEKEYNSKIYKDKIIKRIEKEFIDNFKFLLFLDIDKDELKKIYLKEVLREDFCSNYLFKNISYEKFLKICKLQLFKYKIKNIIKKYIYRW